MATTATQIMSKPARLAPDHLVGGIGGLVFAASLIAQNAIRGLSAPAPEASTAAVTGFYTTHRTSTLVLAVLFPVGAAGLAAFAGALGCRLAAAPFRAPALAGGVGVAGIFATFTMMVATDIALAAYVHGGAADAGVVGALWTVHNAVFAVLLVSIGVALAGLSVSASASGLVTRWWTPIGALGALALLVTGAAAPAVVDGSGIIDLGFAGFVGWVAFVIAAAIALLRQRVACARPLA